MEKIKLENVESIIQATNDNEELIIGNILPFNQNDELDKLEEVFEIMKSSDLLNDLTNDEKDSISSIPPTCYPNKWIYSKAKLNNLLFKGLLNGEIKSIGTEGRNRKELTVKASINFNEIEGVQLSNTNITEYDREVHDSIVSLCVDGGNRYITPLMIYRTMTGNKTSKLPKNKKNFKDIINSVEKLSSTRVYIDASEENTNKNYNIEQPILKENIIYSRSVKGKHKGRIDEWIEILDIPVLYRYANCKNQIARLDIDLLNTPINKTKENIILQGYLRNRILDMKNSELKKRISYKTLYQHLEVKMQNNLNLRKKQFDIRKKVIKILNYWMEQKFINGWTEIKGPKNSISSIDIIL